ncbi:MAG: precorrin-6Y C5,15-methyltransferase subunit CbiT [Cyanobacteria bacterium P01_F01_bin.153]
MALWPHVTPGIPDDLFERSPGIPITKRETRIAILSLLRLNPTSLLWDIGAGTGTIAIESALLCPQGKILAIERDPDVVNLIRHNCDRFSVTNVEVMEGHAPECLETLPGNPDRVCVEGSRTAKVTLQRVWQQLQPGGRVVATATSLDSLYAISESLADIQARNIEIIQSSANRLETRGNNQTFAAINPTFILSGEKF